MIEQNALEILKQVPELKGICDIYKEMNKESQEVLRESLATLLEEIKKRPQAVIPDTEIERIKSVISTTRVAAPDMSGQAETFASKIATYMGPAVQKALDNYLENKQFKLTHEHVTMGQLWRYAEDAAKKRVIILSIVTGLLIAGLVGAGMAYFNSWVYWGFRLEKVCNDPRQTDKDLKGRKIIFDLARKEFKNGKKDDFKDFIRYTEEDLKKLPPM